MGKSSVTLCCVVGGETYENYAARLEESYYRYFVPGFLNLFQVIPGREGWPDGTMYRWHHLLENMPETDYVFMCDADMLIEAPIGSEILSPHVTVTLHPGYVDKLPSELPYEKRPSSSCFVPVEDQRRYYAGGFAGGPRQELKRFANYIVNLIDTDVAKGIVPVWHDESALNKAASVWRDLHILDPSFCYPDNDAHYVRAIWKHRYERKIVALDKKVEERIGRH